MNSVNSEAAELWTFELFAAAAGNTSNGFHVLSDRPGHGLTMSSTRLYHSPVVSSIGVASVCHMSLSCLCHVCVCVFVCLFASFIISDIFRHQLS